MTDRTVTVYSKKPCVQCTATLRKLSELGVEHDILDATLSEHLGLIKGLGYTQAPVVTVEDASGLVDHWSGYQPELLERLK